MANVACAKFIMRLFREYDDVSYVYTIQSRKWFFVMQIIPESRTNENRKIVADPNHAIFRADKLKVILIVNIHNIDDRPKQVTIVFENYVTSYAINQIVVSNGFEGIPYYKTIETTLSCYFPFDFTGKWKEWHKNGQIKTIYECVDGKHHGNLTNWTENNNGPSHKWLECYYVNGKYDGKYMEWFSDGQLKIMGNYDKGVKVDKFVEYYQSGNMKEEEYYIDNKLSGKQTRWHENGFIKEIAHFSNGNLDNMIERWNENGLPINDVNNIW